MKKNIKNGLYALLGVAVGTLGAHALSGCGQKDGGRDANPTIADIMSRTSIRQYTDEPVSDADLEAMLRAGMAAPSACNIQPWKFVVVKDPQIRQALSDSIRPAGPTGRAPVVIVVAGDMRMMAESPVKDYPDYWIEDCSAATENILLAAHSLGLGAVWLGVYPMQERVDLLKGILELPSHITPLGMIAVGHPAENPEPKDKWKAENVHWDKW